MVQAAAFCAAGRLHFRAAVPGGKVVTASADGTAVEPVPTEPGQVCACYGKLTAATNWIAGNERHAEPA